MEVLRDHEPQPSTSTWHVSDGANAGLGSVLVPPTRHNEQSMSEESDDAGETGELLGEVHSILSSRENIQQGGVMVRQDRDDPVGTQAGGVSGNGARSG